MSSDRAKGFAIRRNTTCQADEQTCGSTWNTWKACCPGNSYCPGKDKKYSNNICCPDSSNCTALITNPAICADSSWNLYTLDGKDEMSGSFCCEANQQGFYVSGLGYVGCAGPGVTGSADFIYLVAKTKGTVSSTPTSSSTTATSMSASDSAASTPSNEPISSPHTTNVGAIAGGVVGGVVGLAAIMVAAFFFLRYRKRQPSPQGTKASKLGLSLGYQYAEHREQTAQRVEVGPGTRPAELMGDNTMNVPTYELPGRQ
ncbi:hypothetical protein TrVFT333_009591 [Trichoderma virens FT-333]|nr:hypothetical protein TrVFT333_009591 [Trichoderma virens FT-333]